MNYLNLNWLVWLIACFVVGNLMKIGIVSGIFGTSDK
jgi:hypothetical protein